MIALTPLFPTAAFAAEEGAASGVSAAAQFGQVAMGLAVVVLLILALSVLLRRLKVLPGHANGVIKIIGGLSLGAKERLILVQVGEEQILLSAGAGAIHKIHKLEKAVQPEARPSAEGSRTGFAAVLDSVMQGRRP